MKTTTLLRTMNAAAAAWRQHFAPQVPAVLKSLSFSISAGGRLRVDGVDLCDAARVVGVAEDVEYIAISTDEGDAIRLVLDWPYGRPASLMVGRAW